MFACGVGETQGNGSSLVFQQVALDTGIEGIPLGMNTCCDFHILTICPERRFYLSIPEQKRLLGLLQRCKGNLLALSILEAEADGTEIQTMRVDTEIFRGLFVTTVFILLELHGIHLRVSMPEVKGLLRL